MTTTGTRRRLLLAGSIWTLVLAALLGFTAEPSTSTQFDALEGRGVFVVQPVAHQLVVADLAEVVAGRADASLLLVGAALLLAGASLVAADGDEQLRRMVLRWATSARRGPPALV